MAFVELDGELSCAALTCREPADAVFAEVPLCLEHRRRLASDLSLRPSRFRPEPGVPWFVYYVRWPHMLDVVKIGASANMGSRMNSLRRDGHYPQLLVAERGHDELETERHKQFAALRTTRRGELFRFRSPLTEHIESLRAADPDWAIPLGPLPWWTVPHGNARAYSDLPRCGTVGKNGYPCTLAAGHGTPHPATGPCHHHDPALLSA